MRSSISEVLDTGLKSRDLFAFILLYASSVAILALVVYFWHQSFGSAYPFALGMVLLLLVLLFGYLFARYLLEPLTKRNEELDRLLKETLHELNIPVATIRANVQLLKKNPSCNPKRLSRIQKATDQLLGLYEEVDYLIKKEIDRVEKEPVRIDEVVQERIDLFADLLKERKVEIKLEPFEAVLPKQGFIKAFDNLLSNAIKYSGPGSLIKVSLKKGVLVIEDEGKGIGEEELVRIFERYYQANSKAPGYGIGLAIVKEFCDETGIGVRIDSQAGKGTKVVLDLTKI